MLAEECEPAGLVGGEELRKHQPLEQLGEHGHGEQEAGLARQPSLAIQGDAATRHDHVDMRVMGHGRAPGVEHGGDADAGAQVLGIRRDRQHGLG